VICGIPSANDSQPVGSVTSIRIAVQNLTSASTVVSCTATDGSPVFGIAYAMKEIVAIPFGPELSFDASDFGGVAGQSLPYSDFWSITCALPGNTAIPYLYAKYSVDIGS
jgi:hypothetical protein